MKKRLAFGSTLFLLLVALLVLVGMLRGVQNDNETQVLNYKDLVEQYKEITNSWLIINEDQQELATKNLQEYENSDKFLLESDLSVAIREQGKAINERDLAIATSEEYYSYIEKIKELYRDKFIPEEVREAVTEVQVTFEGTRADFDKIFGVSVLSFFSTRRITRSWFTHATAVSIAGSLTPKFVVARHALFAVAENEADLKKFLTISVRDAQTNSMYDVPIEGLTEFPDLDLVIFDVPSELNLSPLPLYTSSETLPQGEVLVHVYNTRDNHKAFVPSILVQPVLAYPYIPSGEREGRLGFELEPEDYMRLHGRLRPGDSGGPVLLTRSGITYVAGFVLKGYIDKSDDGIAIKSHKLYDKLIELQRSQ